MPRPRLRLRLARRAPLVAVALAVVACGGGGDASDPGTAPPPAGPVDVFTPGNVFSPFSATIPVGGTVRFNISGAAHNVKFDRTTAGAPADVPVVNDVVVARTFGTKGTFPYDCTVHPGMSGQVVVR